MPVPKVFVLARVDCILGLQPRYKTAMLGGGGGGGNTIEFCLEKFRWK